MAFVVESVKERLTGGIPCASPEVDDFGGGKRPGQGCGKEPGRSSQEG
jgi:hypothetical protein